MTNSSAWINYRSVAYLNGKGIIFGATSQLWPQKATAVGQFGVYVDNIPTPFVSACDRDLSMFANESCEYVFVGPRLESIERPEEFLRDAAKRLKPGGHLILNVPLRSAIGPSVVTSFTPDVAKNFVASVGSWRLKDEYVRDGQVLQIYKKTPGARGITVTPRPFGKRACIIRYGAMGDMIILTPLIRALAEDGYTVTMNITPYGAVVLQHNPYISNFIIQPRDAINNPDLGNYWSEWQNDYDRYINLSESLEGALLKVENRREFYTPQAWRHQHCNRNYYDWTLQLGGYPNVTGKRGELYFSADEERAARKFRDRFRDKFLVLWALNGSSHHKVYGLFEQVMTDWLDAHPDAVMVTVGDYQAKLLEFEHPQVVPMAGEWPIRMSMCMTKYADLVVGPETAITNAAGCFETPKIVMLSHSSKENLTKHFRNDYSLEPDPALCPCAPCWQLHYSLASCPQCEILDDTTGKVLVTGPVCAMGAITAETMTARLNQVYSKWNSTAEQN